MSLIISMGRHCHPGACHLSAAFRMWKSSYLLVARWILWADDGLTPGVPANKRGAAAAAKLLQSCPTLCDPVDSSPPGSPVPGSLQARTLEWVAISFSNAWKWKVKVKSLSCVRLWATPWTAPTRLLRPWDFPGKGAGVGCHCFLRRGELSNSKIGWVFPPTCLFLGKKNPLWPTVHVIYIYISLARSACVHTPGW